MNTDKTKYGEEKALSIIITAPAPLKLSNQLVHFRLAKKTVTHA